ncbi:fluoride efflux transporter FluC [Longispora albida]|uniref:fluoride efflux transporter FluC n=1 Tax=Longispora albida TaxID=203523 RepID=UPI000367DD0E|nr:CrcB family protein [Longispora albida]
MTWHEPDHLLTRTALAAAGGAAGALTRYAITTLLITGPLGTLAVNTTGCLLIGLLLTRWPRHRLLLGTGFLGGYTTFSTYITDTLHLPPAQATAYLLLTPAAAITAVTLGRRL